MRIRVLAGLFLAGTLTLTLTLSLIQGQEQPAPKTTTPAPVAEPPIAKPPTGKTESLTELQQQMLLSGRRGADWMFRMHGVKGRFLTGHMPALKQDLEGDHFLRQAAAAAALARAARSTGEERYAVRATQAILALLEDTAVDTADAKVRQTTLPAAMINRLGAAGYLVLAVSELPRPQKDLLEKSEQLCNYIRKQARDDGSLAYHDSKTENDGINEYPGIAMAGLMASQRHHPAEWKTSLVKKALPYYRAWWTKNRATAFVPAMSSAFAEVYARTKDKASADFVADMNDWVAGLQYTRMEPRRLMWYGGFMGWQNGRAYEGTPTIDNAALAESLAQSCRVARDRGDVTRYAQHSETLERALQFLTTLQYSEAGSQHFADWYRPRIVGAFHYSHQDGNLRIEYTQHAVAALFAYLEHAR